MSCLVQLISPVKLAAAMAASLQCSMIARYLQFCLYDAYPKFGLSCRLIVLFQLMQEDCSVSLSIVVMILACRSDNQVLLLA